MTAAVVALLLALGCTGLAITPPGARGETLSVWVCPAPQPAPAVGGAPKARDEGV